MQIVDKGQFYRHNQEKQVTRKIHNAEGQQTYFRCPVDFPPDRCRGDRDGYCCKKSNNNSPNDMLPADIHFQNLLLLF